MISSPAPPAATMSVISRDFRVCPIREPSPAYTDSSYLSLAAVKNLPPLVRAIICSVSGLGGTRMVST